MSVLVELRIPRMGSVENAKLLSWRITEGSAFETGDVICEIETDKTVTDVQAERPGVLARTIATEGADLKVGDLIGLTVAREVSALQREQALLELDRGQHPSGGKEVSQVDEGATTAVGCSSDDQANAASRRMREADVAPQALSPLVRRLAREHGVDPATVEGTGPGGRVTGDDIVRYAEGSRARTSNLSAIENVPPGYDGVPVERVPLSSRRRAIARRLAESARVAPHLTADMEIDLTALLSARARENADRGSAPPLSLLAYIAHATARLLTSHRDLNASFSDAEILRWQKVNLGIAVDTPEGLVVPVIRDAESRSLREIAAAISDVADRARLGTLESRELDGGTFTISNPGSLGPVLRAEAILNPPQVALLGLPAMVRLPVAVQGSDGNYRVEIRPRLRASLTFDHRALDGGHVIRFLNDLKSTIEDL